MPEPHGPSEWTIDTLHVHIQRQIDDLRRMLDDRHEAQTKALDAAFAASEAAVKAALEAADRAVSKAEIASEKRLDSVNEFRGQLADQAATLMPRNEAELLVNRNSEDIKKLTDRFNITSGHSSGMSQGWSYLVSIVALISTLVSLYLLTHH